VSLRVACSLARAGVRHRRELATFVEQQLEGWRRLAESIPPGPERVLALAKLDGESSHARAATMLATLAPRSERAGLARTILAVELLYDHLDGRTEPSPPGDPLEGRRELLRVFEDACAMREARAPASAPDGPYLEALAAAASAGLAALPAVALVRTPLLAAARRAREAQARMHAVADTGAPQLEAWARGESPSSGLGWREHLAGCGASVVCVHALALCAARPAGPAPEAIDRAYLHLAALATLLDGLNDGAQERPSYSSLYEDSGELSEAILALDRSARELLGALGARHAMMLVGIVAHYSALPGAREPRAAATLAALRRRERLPVGIAMLALRSPSRKGERPPLATIRAGDEPAAG
jgi:Protein of unknown function (DUF2600)